MSERLGLCVFANKATQIPIGFKRKRGRPAEREDALHHQPCESQQPIDGIIESEQPAKKSAGYNCNLSDVQHVTSAQTCVQNNATEQPKRRGRKPKAQVQKVQEVGKQLINQPRKSLRKRKF